MTASYLRPDSAPHCGTQNMRDSSSATFVHFARSIPFRIMLLALAMVIPAAAWATTVIHLPLPRLTRLADTIVDATVERTVYRREGKKIFTHVTVRINIWYKGPRKRPGRLQLRVPGGKLGKDWLVVEGMPTFRVGERVLLFLLREPGFYWPLGLQQGKFRITQDQQGRLLASRDFGGTSFLGLSGSPPRRLDYLRLVKRVRGILPRVRRGP